MRVKRRSRHRKVVKFYSTCFGFREPHKVLVDGTFVHHLLVHGLLPADDALRELLSAARPPPLFTSKCIQAELRRLGKSHSQAFDAAQLLATASCEHDKVVSAVDCILSLVGDKNPEHYFVATQDSGLRAKSYEDLLYFCSIHLDFICARIFSGALIQPTSIIVPCVPVIYGLKNSLFIEQPSVQQRKFAQLDEEKRIHMEKSEFKKLLKASSEGKTSVDGNIPGVVAEKSKFKRNRAKGPNPLSCKKKKPKPQPSAAQNQENLLRTKCTCSKIQYSSFILVAKFSLSQLWLEWSNSSSSLSTVYKNSG